MSLTFLRTTSPHARRLRLDDAGPLPGLIVFASGASRGAPFSEVDMKSNQSRPPKWFVPAVIMAATGGGGLLALLIAAAIE